MPTLNPTGIDGTPVDTQRTITLNEIDAAEADSAIRHLLYDALEDRDEPWLDLEPLTVEQLGQYLQDTREIVTHYSYLLRQLEDQSVIGASTAWHVANAVQRDSNPGVAGRDLPEPEPAAPGTGDVTITWAAADLERVAAELSNTGWDGTSGENAWTLRRLAAARAILARLTATRGDE